VKRSGKVRNSFPPTFYPKIIILPRQALDKHGENSRKEMLFWAAWYPFLSKHRIPGDDLYNQAPRPTAEMAYRAETGSRYMNLMNTAFWSGQGTVRTKRPFSSTFYIYNNFHFAKTGLGQAQAKPKTPTPFMFIRRLSTSPPARR
jgi:hypothetical protein